MEELAGFMESSYGCPWRYRSSRASVVSADFSWGSWDEVEPGRDRRAVPAVGVDPALTSLTEADLLRLRGREVCGAQRNSTGRTSPDRSGVLLFRELRLHVVHGLGVICENLPEQVYDPGRRLLRRRVGGILLLQEVWVRNLGDLSSLRVGELHRAASRLFRSVLS